MAKAIGVDIGGTGIKAGIVDLEHGTLDSDRIRIPTPKGAKPADVLATVKEVLTTLGVQDSTLPLGVAFPAIVKHGRTLSAANVAKDWIGFEAERFFEDGLGRQITFVNDADAAGVAESRHGAARDARGLTILATLGTGIGSAFLYDGVLVPNTELGHLDFRGESIEKWAAYSAMERDELDWEEWSARLQDFFSHVEFLFSPDLFVVGGGVSKHPEKFLPLLDLNTPIVAAIHRNSSGIIGAASLAAD
ncbi:polyphosphate--glucose phosphotransferase [Microbacterium azadirachtae]|jgi:polyphosphate glucokinase|uniref:Polyphosphate glucokinase n=1 Tax=Microbacterium azadirachtae TaxID=582680 RepID=A0A0F0L251_9MICO|nr:ROK family protein [Microbacterium azadirachtae]KJL25611.1 Polyphosphate glucokinase [Microbacterium azadirachtae]UXW84456.1 ROK family protein [Microbacterium azadirachtae]SDL30759.1 Polyphosphate glucokinase [Microbacterium azadirachtae]SEF60856.1 Polyphosphate glucokinase [Microbacterium azadirachtae]SEF61463.1 Polyphosphate glucokinase [Microbacterium azadirachtae]